MATVEVVSHHNASRPMKMEGDTVATIARALDLSLHDTVICVDDGTHGAKKVEPNYELKDGEVLSFQRAKVTSGSKYEINVTVTKIKV